MKLDIAKIDKNFLAGSQIDKDDIVWVNILEEPISIRGLAVAKPGKFWRLPEDLYDKVNEGVTGLSQHTAGGRIRFRTDSPYIAYRAKLLFTGAMCHMPLTGSAGADLMLNGWSCTAIRPLQETEEWYEGIFEVPGEAPSLQGMKDVTLSMGLYNGITEAWIGLKAGSVLEAPKPYSIEKPIVFYGSSITQGGCASKPGNCFTALLAKWLDADHRNLGFSGSGRAEENISEYMANLDMSVFVMDYDHNAPDAEYLQKTHYRLYSTVRAKQPELPIVMVSMPDGDLTPKTRAKRRDVVHESYVRARAAGDEKVWFVDGASLFGAEDRDLCTVDGCHPNDLGFYRMAKGILPALKEALGKN